LLMGPEWLNEIDTATIAMELTQDSRMLYSEGIPNENFFIIDRVNILKIPVTE
uniref:Reverse transcriptase domain-containing protein n=1 Tax=Haemonchus placei TaxID=6290 RepID=A0A0N4VZG3_HAEPC